VDDCYLFALKVMSVNLADCAQGFEMNL